MLGSPNDKIWTRGWKCICCKCHWEELHVLPLLSLPLRVSLPTFFACPLVPFTLLSSMPLGCLVMPVLHSPTSFHVLPFPSPQLSLLKQQELSPQLRHSKFPLTLLPHRPPASLLLLAFRTAVFTFLFYFLAPLLEPAAVLFWLLLVHHDSFHQACHWLTQCRSQLSGLSILSRRTVCQHTRCFHPLQTHFYHFTYRPRLASSGFCLWLIGWGVFLFVCFLLITEVPQGSVLICHQDPWSFITSDNPKFIRNPWLLHSVSG